MNYLSDIQRLLLVDFIHFLCNGMVIPVLAPHILLIGGDQIVLGFLITGTFICQKLSREFVALFDHSKNVMLTFCMLGSFVCHLLTSITDSYRIIVLIRWLASLVNCVDSCSKEFVTATQPEETHIKLFNMIDIVKTAGFVIGAILGGYMFDCADDFDFNALVASVFTLIGVIVLQQIDEVAKSDERSENQLLGLPDECCQRLIGLTEINYKQHWDVILLKAAYVTSFVVFFNKYVVLIKYNYNVGTVVIGYTVAYQNMLLFTCNCFIHFLRECLSGFALKEIFDHSLLICSATLMALYYSPTFDCYLLIFIPMVITYTMVNSCMENNVLDLKDKQDISDAINTISTILNIVVPLIFGFFGTYHSFEGNAFKIMSMLPPAACAFVINRRFFRRKEETKEEIKEE